MEWNEQLRLSTETITLDGLVPRSAPHVSRSGRYSSRSSDYCFTTRVHELVVTDMDHMWSIHTSVACLSCMTKVCTSLGTLVEQAMP